MPALDPGLERRLSLWGRWWKSISTLLPRESAQWFWHLRPASIFVVQMIYKYFPLVSPRAREERSHQTLWSENMKVRTRLCVCAPKFPLPITHILSISTHTVSSISKHTHTHTQHTQNIHTHTIYTHIYVHTYLNITLNTQTHTNPAAHHGFPAGWRGDGVRESVVPGELSGEQRKAPITGNQHQTHQMSDTGYSRGSETGKHSAVPNNE